jgi:protein-S-isoprenylcysteine O-methyltransferase Ste14
VSFTFPPQEPGRYSCKDRRPVSRNAGRRWRGAGQGSQPRQRAGVGVDGAAPTAASRTLPVSRSRPQRTRTFVSWSASPVTRLSHRDLQNLGNCNGGQTTALALPAVAQAARPHVRPLPVSANRTMYGRIVRVMALRISRPLNWVIQAGLFPALLVGAPLSLSTMGKRHGWSAERPGAANVAGVLPLSAGTGLLVWAMSSHNRAAPRGWEVGLTPGYLLTRGPYRFSRNPIYVGEAAIWAGWALLFGSLPVATGLAALVVVQRGIVRIEGAHAPDAVGRVLRRLSAAGSALDRVARSV